MRDLSLYLLETAAVKNHCLSVVACALFTISPCLALPAAAEDTIPIRIVNFNAELLNAPGVTPGTIQKYRFDHARKRHLEGVATLIETLNPDIVNLVEVSSKEAVDAVVAILHEKGMTEYKGYHIDSNDPFTAGDVALISKIEPDLVEGQPIRTIYSEEGDPTWRESFSFIGRGGEKVTLNTSISRNSLYFLTVGGHKLGFVGLHLKSNPQDDYSNAKRTAEAAVVRRIINGEVTKRGYQPVVIGDLNDYDPDVPDADESRATSTTVIRDIKDYDPAQDGPELVNVAEKIARQADRYTSHWDRNENGADDGDDVYTMIDHILLPKDLMPFVTRAFICHSVGIDTSDHFAVVVDLDLPVQK